MSTTIAPLFTPYTLGHKQLANRLAVAPMTRISAEEDGTVGALMPSYYEAFAQGGFGLIITEGLYSDEHYSQGYYRQPGMANAMHSHSWAPVVQRIHAHDTHVIAQLMHAGALSQHNRFNPTTIAPSAVVPMGEQMTFYHGKGAYPTPRAMAVDDIDTAIKGFANAAQQAKAAGFDGVEIHGANGYLLDQFLTTYTNTRSDHYGGDIHARLHIYRDVIRAVKHAVGDAFIVGVRVSQKKVNDQTYVWPGGERDAQALFEMIGQCGAHYIHTTEPMLDQPAFEQGASLAFLAKKYSQLPVIANGGVAHAAMATAALADQHGDIIALGKAALANPCWPAIVREHGVLADFDYDMLAPTANLETANDYHRALTSH